MILPAEPPLPLPRPLPLSPPGGPAGGPRSPERQDAELVSRCNAGEAAAFAEIVARHRSRIHAVALGVLRNQTDAEEITQDTFIRAHCALARFRGDSSLSTWLHRIALNLARNRYWYFFRRKRHVTQSLECPLRSGDPATLADRVADEAPDQARTVMLEEFSALVAACVGRLDVRPREILLLRAVRDLSYEEIAAELGIGIGTVKSRLARARDSLRKLVDQDAPDFGATTSISAWFDQIRPSPACLRAVGY